METIVKKFVCLAVSRKPGGRCVALREWHGDQSDKAGNWIRPVSGREREAVTEDEMRYDDGSYPELLDIVRAPFVEHLPDENQTENWLIARKPEWETDDCVEWDDLKRLEDPVADLWVNGNCSKIGFNDWVSHAQAITLSDSLRFLNLSKVLISVVNAPTYVDQNGEQRWKRQVRASFSFNNQEYGLKVTDPDFEEKYLKMDDGDYEIGECYVTISLAGPMKGNRRHFKLVAAIIEPPV